MKKMFQVFEISSNGGYNPVSKCYPTKLGCQRVCNRITSENFLVGYRYIVQVVFLYD